MKRTFDRLDELLLRRDDDALTEAEAAELEAMLRDSRELRRRLVEHAMISGVLRERLAGRAEAVRAQVAPRRIGALTAIASVAALAAAAVLVVVVGSTRSRPQKLASDPVLEALLEHQQREISRVPMFLAPPAEEPSALAEAAPATPARLAAAPGPGVRAGRFPGLTATVAALTPTQAARLRSWAPSTNGLYLHGGRDRFSCAAQQRYAMDMIAVGAALRERLWVEQGWAGLEAAFAHQRPEGNFGDSAVCVAVFLGAAVSAFDALEQGPYAREYAPRMAALRPALRRAALWLAAPARVAQLRREDRNNNDPSFAGAAALAFVGAREGLAEVEQAAFALAEAALGRQREDGAFRHLGGHDSGLQIHAVVQMHWMLRWLSTDRLDEAARRAGEWLFERIRPDGSLDLGGNSVSCEPGDGRACRHVSYRDLRWALALHGTRFDPSALRHLDAVFAGEVRAVEQARRGREPPAKAR